MTDQLQEILGGFMDGLREERSRYHLTLGEVLGDFGRFPRETQLLITAPDGTCLGGAGDAASYRGYYSDLAFSPVPRDRAGNVGEFVDECSAAFGATFRGYKGGDFEMWGNTPLWIAEHGREGLAVVGFSPPEANAWGAVVLLTKDIL